MGAGFLRSAIIAALDRFNELARFAHAPLVMRAGGVAILRPNFIGFIWTSWPIPKHALQRFSIVPWGGMLILYGQCDGKHGKRKDHNGDQKRNSYTHSSAR